MYLLCVWLYLKGRAFLPIVFLRLNYGRMLTFWAFPIPAKLFMAFMVKRFLFFSCFAGISVFVYAIHLIFFLFFFARKIFV